MAPAPPSRMDPTRLDEELEAAFGGTARERRVVAREARDLADSGKPERDRGHALTASDVVRNLSDAPAGSSLVERWNWWLGALDTAYGGYARFTVRAVGSEDEADANR